MSNGEGEYQDPATPNVLNPAPTLTTSDEVMVGSRFSGSLHSDEFAKWLESAQEILDTLYTDLTGKQLRANADGELVWARIGNAKCTEACAEFMLMRLRNILNPNTFMSFYHEDDITKMCEMQADTFVFTLAKMSDHWGLESYMQDELLAIFRHHLFSGMRRALNANEKRLFAVIQRAQEVQYPAGMPPQPQTQGLGGAIGGFFRR